jgi:hypothetical protein
MMMMMMIIIHYFITYMGCTLVEQPSTRHRYPTQAQTAYYMINYITSLTLINKHTKIHDQCGKKTLMVL